MWEEALRVARENGLSDIAKLKEGFLKHLVDTGQEERAGAMKEQEGEYGESINLYMRAGLPSKACSILLQHPSLIHQSDLVERIAAALIKGGLYEKAGELFEKVYLGIVYSRTRQYIRGSLDHHFLLNTCVFLSLRLKGVLIISSL